jgi:aspartyl-tRNA(Asn)/glutamyl-tRNA(Gln) amidotransferase subunit A
VPNYQANLSDDIRGLKVGVVKERVYSDVVDAEVGEAVIRAIARMGELGADIEEVSLPQMVHSAAVSSLIIMVDAASLHKDGLAHHLDEYDYNNRIRLLAGSIVPAQAYQRALKARQALRQEILEALKQVDVLVMPTSSIPASLIPASAGINSKQEVLDGYAGRRSFTSPFNLASVPALSVPCGFTGNNLPIGLQIAGRPYQEQTLFNAAYAYEQANDWYKMHPDV